MQPIKETAQVLSRLSETADDDLMKRYTRAGQRVTQIVPECVGMSLTLMPESLVFAWLASSLEAATLDGVQYVAGRPCADAATAGTTVAIDDTGGWDETRWHAFVMSAAASGVGSTLSLPLRHGNDIRGGVNLYASTKAAFSGRHEQIATVFGAFADEAVTNADLGFMTHGEAVLAPERLDELDLIGQAVGMMASIYGLDADEARGRLTRAADRAGIPASGLAKELVTRGFGRSPDL